MDDTAETDMQTALKALASEFPGKSDRISRLVREDARFAKLASAYQALNREISRGESSRSRSTDIEHLRKMRGIVRNKLEIYLN